MGGLLIGPPGDEEAMFSDQLLRWVHSTTHGEVLLDATHYGEGGVPGQGPYLQLWLRAECGRVTRAGWKTYGCPTAMACGEALCTVAEGRPLDRLPLITAEDIRLLVGGVPEGKEHCPELAALALADALANPVEQGSGTTGGVVNGTGR